MSEETKKNEAHDEFLNHTYTTKTSDPMLHDLVVWANKGITQGITISVNGVIYSGQLIGGAEWCDLQIQRLSQGGVKSAKEALEAAISYYKSYKEEYYSNEAIERKGDQPFHLLHLKDARVWDGVNLSNVQMHWRFEIGEVDGFSIGALEKSNN